MTQHEVEIRCACYIANLEGRRHLNTTGFNDPPFLEDLDRRLRFIELRNDSATATPTQAPTWETLAWRVCRLDNFNNTKGMVPPKTINRSFFGSLLPDTMDVDFDTLVRIVADLVAKVTVTPGMPPGIGVGVQGQMAPLPKLVDDEEKLDIIRQRLFFIAGKRQYRIAEVPLTKRQVYILAADLSLDAETTAGPPGISPFSPIGPPAPSGWVGRHGGARRKPCCGCCTCRCHSLSNRIDLIAPPKKSKFKNFFKFRWLRSLACWKKKKVYTSSSSSSSGSLIDA